MRTIFLFALVFAAPAWADAQANVNHPGHAFTATGGRAKLVLDENLSDATITHGKKSYRLAVGRDRATNGEFYLSEDGRSVLYVRKRAFLGNVLDDPRSVGLKPEPLEGLALWRDGKLLVTRDWEALLTRSQMFGRSVSHVHWVISQKVDWKKNEAELVTTSFRRYRLRLTDGKFLEESDLPSFVAAPRIAYGPVHGGDTETLEAVRWVKGTGPAKLKVRREAGAPPTETYTHWVVPEPVDGVAVVKEYVDEGTAAERREQSAATERSSAQKHPAFLVVGAEARRSGEETEFLPSAKGAYFHLAVQDWLAKPQKMYRALLLMPATLGEDAEHPFNVVSGKALLFEEGGQWSEVRVRVDLLVGKKEVDGKVEFRSPLRDDLVEARLVANPFARFDVGGTLAASLGPLLAYPKVERYRFVESK